MIPNKSTFKFQELTPITGVKPYVIRFWETEFDDIAPVISDSGQKLYARKDVEAILKIKSLLFEEKMTITEAKVAIKNNDFNSSTTASSKEVVEASKDLLNKTFIKEAIIASLQVIKEVKAKHNW